MKTGPVANGQASDLASGRKPRMRLSARIRQASFTDYAQIAALQARNELPSRGYEEWVRAWRGNPAYDAAAGEWPIGWVLQNNAGEVVGSISNIPLAYRFGRRHVRAACASTWMVDAAYRGHSMSMLQKLSVQPDVDLLVSSASPASGPAFQFLQWSRPPVGRWDRSALWITNYAAFVKSALMAKSLRLPALVNYPIAGFLFVADRLSGWVRRRYRSRLEIERVSGFDSRFDEFWEELQHQEEHTLLAVRSRAALEWHFRKSLAHDAVWIWAVTEGRHLVAYAVFDRADNPSYELKRVRLADYRALSGFEAGVGLALRAMLCLCREEGIAALEDPGCSLDRVRPDSIPAPRYRDLPCWMYYYKANSQWLRDGISDSGGWATSIFDGVASL